MPDSTPELPSLSPFDRHLLAERLRIRRNDQTLLSAAHVRAKVKPHQWAAVQQALQGIPPRVLLADDGDLGRRTQAMALLKELALRGQADRVLVMPAGGHKVKSTWARTMHDDFGLDMEVAGHSWVNTHRRDPDLWQKSQQRVVVPQSMLTYADRGRDLVCAPWDVIVVERALDRLHDHEQAESRAAYAAEAVQNARARIFCCEQPHRKGPEAFWDLIELLDPFSTKRDSHSSPSPIVRRSLATVVDRAPTPALSYESVAVELSEAEHAFHTAATTYIRDVYPVMKQHPNTPGESFTTGMTEALMAEPMAFAGALQERVHLIEGVAGITLSETAQTMLAGKTDVNELSEAAQAEAQDELQTLAEVHPDVMFEDELNRIADLVETARSLRPHGNVEAARTLIDQIRSEEPEALIVVRVRYLSTVQAMKEACADAPWYDQMVLNDSFLQKKPDYARLQAELDAKTAPVFVTASVFYEINCRQPETVHVINCKPSWNPVRTRQTMRRMQRSIGARSLAWYDLHMAGTREGELIATMHEHVYPLYAAVNADSTVAGMFSRLDATHILMHAVRSDVPGEQMVQAVQAELDAGTKELRAWQDSSFFACSWFDADDKTQIDAMVDAAHQCYGTPAERAALVAATCREHGGTWTPHDDDTYTVALSSDAEPMRGAFDPDTARSNEVSYLSPGHPLIQTAVGHVLESETLSAPVAQKHVRMIRAPGITFVYRLAFKDGNGRVVHEALYPLHVPLDGSGTAPEKSTRVLQAGTEAPDDAPIIRSLRAQRTTLQTRAAAALHEQVPMIEAQLASARRARAGQEEERLEDRTPHHGELMTEAEAVDMGHRYAAVDTHRRLNAHPPVLVGWCYAVPE